MERVRNRVGGDGGRRVVRYCGVSAFGVVLTQALLVGCLLVGVGAAPANVVACMAASVPIFSINRRWVWEQRSRADLRAEVVPFWILTVLGVVVSTVVVDVVATVTTAPLLLSGANIAAFGLLWVAKFFVLDDAAAAAAAVPVRVATAATTATAATIAH